MMKRLQIAACAIRKEGGVEIKENFLCKLEDALVAGKGLGEDRTNGDAARPAVAAREGRERERRESERRESFEKQREGCE